MKIAVRFVASAGNQNVMFINFNSQASGICIWLSQMFDVCPLLNTNVLVP